MFSLLFTIFYVHSAHLRSKIINTELTYRYVYKVINIGTRLHDEYEQWIILVYKAITIIYSSTQPINAVS